MRQYRKDVIVYLRDPNKKCYHVVVELKNRPGAMASIASLVAESSLNVLSSFTYAESGAEYGVWSLFAEDGSSNPEELKRLLMSSPFARDVIINENHDGFVSDSVHFPLTLNNGDRAMLVQQAAFSNMLTKIRETFGTGGDVIVYDEGRLMGCKAGEDFRRGVQEDFIRRNVGRLTAFHSSVGWFKAELVKSDADAKSFTIRIQENFECMGKESSRPWSQFVRGNLTGFYGALFDMEFRCVETKCVASGSQCCEFSLMAAQRAPIPQPLAN